MKFSFGRRALLGPGLAGLVPGAGFAQSERRRVIGCITPAAHAAPGRRHHRRSDDDAHPGGDGDGSSERGGLIFHGPDPSAIYGRLGAFVDRIRTGWSNEAPAPTFRDAGGAIRAGRLIA